MNTTTITKALQAARECIHADRTSFADCSIGPGNTMEPDDAEALAEYDAVLALVDEALAALQPQPAAAVSDEEIRHDANLPFVEDEHGAEWVTLSPAMFARSVRRVLALRPQAVPMTDQQILKAMSDAGWPEHLVNHVSGAREFTAALARRRDEARGITAQGAQGEEGE